MVFTTSGAFTEIVKNKFACSVSETRLSIAEIDVEGVSIFLQDC